MKGLLVFLSLAFFLHPLLHPSALCLSLRSLAETELKAAPTTTQTTAAQPPGLQSSVATVEALSPRPPEQLKSPWLTSLSWQSFQPLGEFPLSGLSALDLSRLPKSDLLEAELQTELHPGLAAYLQLAGSRSSLALEGPQGARIERTHLSSFVLLGGLSFELHRWGQRPLILGLKTGVGQVSHIVSSSWIEANQSGNQWFWSLGPSLAWEFSPGLRSYVNTHHRGLLSPRANIDIERAGVSFGLQVDLGVLR